jgi:hypothetical protein
MDNINKIFCDDILNIIYKDLHGINFFSVINELKYISKKHKLTSIVFDYHEYFSFCKMGSFKSEYDGEREDWWYEHGGHGRIFNKDGSYTKIFLKKFFKIKKIKYVVFDNYKFMNQLKKKIKYYTREKVFKHGYFLKSIDEDDADYDY